MKEILNRDFEDGTLMKLQYTTLVRAFYVLLLLISFNVQTLIKTNLDKNFYGSCPRNTQDTKEPRYPWISSFFLLPFLLQRGGRESEPTLDTAPRPHNAKQTALSFSGEEGKGETEKGRAPCVFSSVGCPSGAFTGTAHLLG